MTSRVLIVDDSRPMRELLRMTLADVAVVVGECENGVDAVDAYLRLRPDWVLMDVDMPGMDGITATGQIVAAYPNAQVMIVSDHDDVELRRASIEAGAKRYVSKEDLLSILEILAA